jgi:hypothetical protein
MFGTMKITIKRAERKPVEWEKNHDLIDGYYPNAKELQLNSKKINSLI